MIARNLAVWNLYNAAPCFVFAQYDGCIQSCNLSYWCLPHRYYLLSQVMLIAVLYSGALTPFQPFGMIVTIKYIEKGSFMREIPIGEVIRNRRRELGLTQAKVCEGICEPMTLSRIENGQQAPSYNRVKAILQRLDLPDDRYTALLDTDELKLEDLMREADARESLFWDASAQDRPKRREEALGAIQKLEDFAGEDRLAQQFTMGLKVSLGKVDGPYSLDEKLELLMEAVRITLPKFDLNEINDLRYSRGEMALIIRIANAYALAGERRKVIDIYGQLLRYTRKHGWDQPRYADHLALILNNYARELDIDKRYEEAIEIARLGWDICIKYSEYRCLPNLLAIQANAYAHLGEKQKGEDLYHQAFYFHKALGDFNNIAHLKNDARDTLGIELG